MRASLSSLHSTRFNFALAFTLVVLFYGAALGFELLWDDLFWVNDFRRYDLLSLLKSNLSANTLVSYYRPLVAASLSLQLAVSQSPVFLHGFNLALHILNLWLVILLARRTSPRTIYRLPLAVTALAIHPVLVEPVVWVSGRFDLFYSSFLLLSLVAAVRVRSPGWRWLSVLVTFFAALCCKESALAYVVVGPLLLAVIKHEVGPWHRQWRDFAWHGAALLTACAAYLVLRLRVLELPLVRDTAFHVQSGASAGEHGLLILRTFGTYLQMTLLPLWNLAPLHEVTVQSSGVFGYAAAGLMVVTLAVAGLRWPVWLPVTAWTLALLPAANLVPFRLDLVQSRYLYFPLFAAALVALHIPYRAPTSTRHRRLLSAMVGLWLCALAATNLSIVRLWRDGVSLFSWVVSMRPDSRFALENLALAQQAAGHYAQAIAVESRIVPAARSFQGWLLLARASRDSGELTAALNYFKQALATPAYDDAMQVSAMYEVALVLKQLGDAADSAQQVAAADALAQQRHVSARLCDYYHRALAQ